MVLFTEASNLTESATVHQVQEPTSLREEVAERQQEHEQRESPVINRHQRNHCNHRNQCNQRNHIHEPTVTEEVQSVGTDNTVQQEQQEAFHQSERCPHHPHAHLVRFDPAGQAWCDKLDCWDCYRLMKIGEALEYRCLTDLGGKVVIDQGMAAWSAFVLSQRPFLVVVATEKAIALCKAMGIEVPDISGEVKRLVEVRQLIM